MLGDLSQGSGLKYRQYTNNHRPLNNPAPPRVPPFPKQLISQHSDAGFRSLHVNGLAAPILDVFGTSISAVCRRGLVGSLWGAGKHRR